MPSALLFHRKGAPPAPSTVYVDFASGNDTFPGSEGLPKATLSAAYSAVPAGGTILVKRGGRGYLAAPLTVAKQLTIDAYGVGNLPIIDRYIPLTVWSNVSGSGAPLFAESFDQVTGFDQPSWTKVQSGGGTINEDTPIATAGSPPNWFGQCCQFVTTAGNYAFIRRLHAFTAQSAYWEYDFKATDTAALAASATYTNQCIFTANVSPLTTTPSANWRQLNLMLRREPSGLIFYADANDPGGLTYMGSPLTMPYAQGNVYRIKIKLDLVAKSIEIIINDVTLWSRSLVGEVNYKIIQDWSFGASLFYGAQLATTLYMDLLKAHDVAYPSTLTGGATSNWFSSLAPYALLDGSLRVPFLRNDSLLIYQMANSLSEVNSATRLWHDTPNSRAYIYDPDTVGTVKAPGDEDAFFVLAANGIAISNLRFEGMRKWGIKQSNQSGTVLTNLEFDTVGDVPVCIVAGSSVDVTASGCLASNVMGLTAPSDTQTWITQYVRAPVSTAFTPDIFMDPTSGNDGLNGLTEANAVRTPTRVNALMSSGKKLGIKQNTTINTYGSSWVISGWTGCTVGMYGSGGTVKPKVKNSQIYTTGFEFVGGIVWRRSIGSMPNSSGYAATTVTFATICIVNDSNVCTYYARNGSGEVGASGRTDMFWHTNGYIYFCAPTTPTMLEVPWEDPIRISGSNGLTLQDVNFGGSRGHCLIVSGCNDLTIQNCVFERAGLCGMYIQSKGGGVTTNNLRIINNVVRDTHAEGMAIVWPGNERNCFRNLFINGNQVYRCCKGPPIINSGATSQDFYSAGIKLFTGKWENATWYNSGEISDNLIYDMGDLNVPYAFGTGSFYYGSTIIGYQSNQAQGIWVDTVTGHTTGSILITRNTIRDTWAAGIFFEMCPAAYHSATFNVIHRTGLQLDAWSGGICFGRGTTFCSAINNTIAYCKRGGIIFQATSGNDASGYASHPQTVGDITCQNNIIYVEDASPYVLDRSGRSGSNIVFQNNCFYGSSTFQYRGDTNYFSGTTGYSTPITYASASGRTVTGSVTANPLFVSGSTGDFTLQSSSPCKLTGVGGVNIGAK